MRTPIRIAIINKSGTQGTQAYELANLQAITD